MHGGQWMVVLIVLIAVVGGIVKNRYRYQTRIDSDRQPVDSADTIRLRDEVRTLKERVQVLERVITDNHGSVDLDRQIEQLRDR